MSLWGTDENYPIIIKDPCYLFHCLSKLRVFCSPAKKTTVMIRSFWTDRSGQTVLTKIRLQSDQGLHGLPFHLHLLDTLLNGKPACSNFRINTSNFLGVQIFIDFRVHMRQGNLKFFKVREFYDLSGKNEILPKCQGNCREFYISVM